MHETEVILKIVDVSRENTGISNREYPTIRLPRRVVLSVCVLWSVGDGNSVQCFPRNLSGFFAGLRKKTVVSPQMCSKLTALDNDSTAPGRPNA